MQLYTIQLATLGRFLEPPILTYSAAFDGQRAFHKGEGMKDIEQARRALLQIFQAALARVQGRAAVRRYLQANPLHAACSLLAIGKAAQSMALGAVDALGGRLVDGLVISKPGHLDQARLTAAGLIALQGGHPVPDAQSLQAGAALTRYLAALPAGRPLLCLISGGASSLVEVLREGRTLEHLQLVNRWLLASGLPIQQMNLVRKALSAVKGGGLLRYLAGRPVSALMISDVPDDDPAVIGSGLLVADSGSRSRLAGIDLPPWVSDLIAHDEQPAAAGQDAVVDIHILATLRDAREAAAEEARRLGYPCHLSHAFISAGAENSGRRLALELLDSWPGVYVWGGEPTVQLPASPGRGGRNQHLALAAARVLDGRDDVCFLSAGTDGTDGPGEDAGALVDGGTIGRGRRQGLSAADCLAQADSGSFLQASGDLIHTGPTGTNVMDLMLGLKLESAAAHA
jgi:hydroxypyruvate reductase